ncbi:MAG: anthranilate synthase subunit II [Candidatus Adiutrix intracellularis]|jgi:anthranilate synthase component 2|nr:MAG: anthranilate synthase subunit II [Candidatus Adiutrix intracellularis]MDR2827195.1 aminodeoxychorismate/anthranilate synthase component II [Candidatus Adiutrix intracellularis]
MRLLLIDNYDSFTYNLWHLLKELCSPNDRLQVIKNDEVDLKVCSNFNKIILSPGPGIPAEAGILLPLIERYAPTRPILGICLGHQAIGQIFGATLLNLDQVFHGLASNITIIKKSYIFNDLPDQIQGGRYHSWTVNRSGFPTDLEITAVDAENQIMALSHKKYDVHGLQFHPESILTPDGKKILANFLSH